MNFARLKIHRFNSKPCSQLCHQQSLGATQANSAHLDRAEIQIPSHSHLLDTKGAARVACSLSDALKGVYRNLQDNASSLF
jgi:hypothetical protein